MNAVPDMDGKFAAASQVTDEARHVEVFARYLECHGKRFPIDPDLESIALSFFRLGEEMAVEPVLAQFIGRVHEDEARHVAYGMLTPKDRIPELPEKTRTRLENWAYDAIARIGGRAGKPGFSSQFQALAETGIDLGTFLPKLLAEVAHPENLDRSGLRAPMAQTVIPNLLRIGLVPERLVPGYLAQGWRIDRAAKTVEDVHTFGAETKAMRAVFREQGVDFADPKAVSRASL